MKAFKFLPKVIIFYHYIKIFIFQSGQVSLRMLAADHQSHRSLKSGSEGSPGCWLSVQETSGACQHWHLRVQQEVQMQQVLPQQGGAESAQSKTSGLYY